MKRFSILSVFFSFLLFFLYSNAWAGPGNEIENIPNGIIMGEFGDEITVEGVLNTRYLRKPNKYAVVFRKGFNAKIALFIANADVADFYQALAEIGARPGDNMELDSDEGVKTEGTPLDVFVTWDGADDEYALEELISDNYGNEFDFRFSGNLKNSEEVSSGCLLCLDSCPIGIAGNAIWGNRAYDQEKVFFKVNRHLLPPNGTPVKIMFELAQLRE